MTTTNEIYPGHACVDDHNPLLADSVIAQRLLGAAGFNVSRRAFITGVAATAFLEQSTGVSVAMPSQSETYVAPTNAITTNSPHYTPPQYDTVGAANNLAKVRANFYIGDETNGLGCSVHDMHTHNSWSEGTASAGSIIKQAEANQVDVTWSSNHGWRREVIGMPLSFTFDQNTFVANKDNMYWKPKPLAGKPNTKVAQVVAATNTTPAGLQLSCKAGVAGGSFGVQCTTNNEFEGNAYGRSININNLFLNLKNATFDVMLTMSTRSDAVTPGYESSIKSDQLSLIYRLSADPTLKQPQKSVSPDGMTVTYLLPIQNNNGLNNLSVCPLDDIAYALPNLTVPEDLSMVGIALAITTQNGTGTAIVPELDLPREVTGDDMIVVEKNVLTAYQKKINSELIFATEVSSYAHYGWMAEDSHELPALSKDIDIVKMITSSGGVAIKNHMYGTTVNQLLPADTRANMVKASAKQYLVTMNVPFDAFEMYPLRGGDLDDFCAISDMFVEDGKITTEVGSSDDHAGLSIVPGPHRPPTDHFLSQIWSTDRSVAAYQSAVKNGRVSLVLPGYTDIKLFTHLGEPGSHIADMGDVLINSNRTSFPFTIMAKGMPATAVMRIKQNTITYRRNIDVSNINSRIIADKIVPNSKGIFTYPDLDLTANTAFKVEIYDPATGQVFARSNPIYSMTSANPQGTRTDRPILQNRAIVAPSAGITSEADRRRVGQQMVKSATRNIAA